MAIFTVSFVIVLIDPTLLNGAFGWLALISVLFGVGFFLIVKFVLKDKEPPAYLPAPDEDAPSEGETSPRTHAETEREQKDED